MANWYVSAKNGLDSNAGTSAGAAFRTIGKALGAGIMSSGDNLYIQPGTYRETVTCSMTNPTSQTYIIGDVTGQYFNQGISGEVQWTGYLINDESLPSTNNNVLNLNSKNFLSFKNITFVLGPNSNQYIAAGATSQNIQFINCCFLASNNNYCILLTCAFNTALNWLISGCMFIGTQTGGTRLITIDITTGTGSDYNMNLEIDNCIFIGGSYNIRTLKVGANANFGGGINIKNCIFFCSASNALLVGDNGISLTYPITMYNCIFFQVGISANNVGEIIENNNIFYCTIPRTNVAIGPQSVSNFSVAPLFHFGQEQFYGGQLKPFGMPYNNSPFLCNGDLTIAPTTDLLNIPRPNGDICFIDNGYTSSGNAILGTFYDYAKNLGINTYAGLTLKIMNGPASGLCKTINSNSGYLFSGDGQWPINPATGNQYIIFQGPTSLDSVVSSGFNVSTTGMILKDNFAKWGNAFWQGYTCLIKSGVASGQTFYVSGNDGNNLITYGQWGILPASGDIYNLYWSGSGNGISGEPMINTTVGCYSISNTSIKDSTNYLSGTNSIRLCGPSYQDFQIPVSGSGINTTINCWSMYDQYYTGTLPQLAIKNGSYIGISDNTGTLNVGTGIWGQISVTITPSGQGIVTARCISNTTGIGSNCWFGNFSIV